MSENYQASCKKSERVTSSNTGSKGIMKPPMSHRPPQPKKKKVTIAQRRLTFKK